MKNVQEIQEKDVDDLVENFFSRYTLPEPKKDSIKEYFQLNKHIYRNHEPTEEEVDIRSFWFLHNR